MYGFEHVRFHGEAASILWGYHPAAVVKRWSITRSEKEPGKWTLTAVVDRLEPFMLRQRPLLFTAPRQKAGFWLWPIEGDVQSVADGQIRATLSHAEF